MDYSDRENALTVRSARVFLLQGGVNKAAENQVRARGLNRSGLLDHVAENVLRIQSAFRRGLRRGCLLAQADGAKAHLIQNLINKPFVQIEQWGQNSSANYL